jgi:hypothetical protein
MDHSLVIGWLAPGRRNHRGVSRNLSGEKIRAVRGPSRKISKFPKIQKMMAMANLPDFAKHREKRNFAKMFIHSAERDSVAKPYQRDTKNTLRSPVACAAERVSDGIGCASGPSQIHVHLSQMDEI